MSELKPCPWCPVEPRIRHNRNGIGSEAAARKLPELWEVSCAHAERHGRTYGKTRDEAIGAWNRRTHQGVTPAMVERLEATIDRIEELNARRDERMQKLGLPVTPAGGEVGVQTLVARLESEARLLIACLGRSENASDVRVMREAADFIRSHPPVADAALARDAERWRALVGSARVRVLGSAGILGDVDPNGAPFNGYAHIGLELWTQHSAGNSPADASFMLTRYADIAALNQRGGDRG